MTSSQRENNLNERPPEPCQHRAPVGIPCVFAESCASAWSGKREPTVSGRGSEAWRVAGSLQALWQRGKSQKNVRKSKELGSNRRHHRNISAPSAANKRIPAALEGAVRTNMHTCGLEFCHVTAAAAEHNFSIPSETLQLDHSHPFINQMRLPV